MEGQADGQAGHLDDVVRHTRALREEAGALCGGLRGMAQDLGHALDLKGRMEKSPWLTLAQAVGVGYLLGGGLFTRTTGRLVHLGARALLLPLVRSQLSAMMVGMESAPGSGGSQNGPSGM